MTKCISSRVEADNATLASLSSRILIDETGPRREIVLGRSRSVESSVTEAARQISGEARRALLAQEYFQRLVERTIRIS